MSAGSNKFGQLFQWTSFGESHGPAMGVVIDGCPAGVPFDENLLLNCLARRRPGSGNALSATVSERNETDQPEILSGVFEGRTLGTPIACIVRNRDARSTDYDQVEKQPRAGHADDLWPKKFGNWDHRGGGRASARETVNWVIAGAFAQMFCRTHQPQTAVEARVVAIGETPVQNLADTAVIKMLEQARREGESFGAIVAVNVFNPPALLGEPVFAKAKSEFARAYMSINACTGVELGDGFTMAEGRGTSVHHDFSSLGYGGIRGGITTGETMGFRLAFKPTASIKDVAKSGRHDPCVGIRAVPIVEAMTWNVLADLILQRRLNRVDVSDNH